MTDPADEALRLISKMGDAVLNAVDQGIYCLDTLGQTIFVNEAAARMLGYTLREMMGKRQHDLIHHHYADGSPFPIEACPIQSTVTDGVQQRVGGDVFWKKDGTPLPVDYTSIPVKEGRRTAAVVVTFRDASLEVKARQQAERLAAERAAREAAEQARAALMDAEIRVALALEAGQMGTWEWDIATNRVSWSAQQEAIFGLATGGFPGTVESYRDLIHPDDREASAASLRRAVESHAATYHVQHRIVRPNGDVRWIESHARFSYDAEGRPLRLTGVSSDRTQQHEAEQARDRAHAEAETARKQLVSVFEQAPAAIAVLDGPMHIFTTVNARYRALIGGQPAVGRSIREVFAGQPELEPFFGLLDEVYRTGKPYVGNRVKARLLRNGEPHDATFNFIYQPLTDADGRVTSIMVHAVELEGATPSPG